MYIDSHTNPPGVNSMLEKHRMPVLRLTSGDTCHIDITLWAPCGAPAHPDNCYVEFVLSENQFSPPLWTGEWFKGMLPDENRPGLVHVVIPHDKTKTLRRGSYMFSARVSDRTKYEFDTQERGYLLVEYAPTSDQHSIPYRDGTSKIFSGGKDKESGQEDEEFLIDETGGKWVLGVTDAGALTTTPVGHVPRSEDMAASERASLESEDQGV